MRTRRTGSEIVYVAVVDDDESTCRSFSRLLRVAGFQPVSYASAEALLEDTKRPHFDCLVLDIHLSGMSGLELSRRLAAVRDTTPVVFITAHDDPEVHAEAQAGGCAGFFRKNEPAEAVIAAILRATEREAAAPPPTIPPRNLNQPNP